MLILDQLNRADRHLRVLAWTVSLGMAVLLGGLWWNQIIQSRNYVEDQRTQAYRTVRVPAPRGRILDRNSVPLADSRASYNICLYLEDPAWRERVHREYDRTMAALTGKRPKLSLAQRVASFFRQDAPSKRRRLTAAQRAQIGRRVRFNVTSNLVQELARALGQPLTIDEENFHKHYQQRRALPMPVLTDIPPSQVARFQELSVSLPGFDMEIQPLRVYPHETLAAHTIGYLRYNDESVKDELAFYHYRLPDYRGVSGLEAALDEELRGHAGAKSVLVNNLGYRQSETILSPIEPGQDVTLTLDVEIQKAAEYALARAPGAYPPIRGAAVVLDVRTGEILALASAPTFNPNDWIPRLSLDTWNTYTNEDIAPLIHRAVYGGFMPGSTFKIFVGIAGLEAGTLNPAEVFHNEGVYRIGSRVIDDLAAAGDYDFKRAFIKSSNSYFIEHGLKVGAERLLELARQFHFGERTGIPLGQDGAGLIPTREYRIRERGGLWSPGDTANFCLGQGELKVTPLQLAVAVAAVANGGKVLWPQLVRSVVNADEPATAEVRQPMRPRIRGQLPVSPRTLEIVREAMAGDVEIPGASAYSAFHPDGHTPALKNFRVCGKTGTAQVFKQGRFHHWTVWFASFAPYEDPRYAVVVMVDYGTFGGTTAAPVTREIYKALQQREQRVIASRF